jgi:hypothetical protein
MKKELVGVLIVLVLLLTSCPQPPVVDTDGTWDSSNWDSTVVWR